MDVSVSVGGAAISHGRPAGESLEVERQPCGAPRLIARQRGKRNQCVSLLSGKYHWLRHDTRPDGLNRLDVRRLTNQSLDLKSGKTTR